MIILKNFTTFFIVTAVAFLLLACGLTSSVYAQTSSTIHLPIVANGHTFESLDSYRITHTSIFTHPNSSRPENVVYTRKWQRAENQYGFNSEAQFEIGGNPMQEMYLIDEDAYVGMFGIVESGARAEIDVENSQLDNLAIPLLTVNDENGETGVLGPNGGLPATLSEIISQSQIGGSEIINGVSTSHYQLNNVDLLSNQVVFGQNATIISAEGDFWVANDGEHVIRFVVRAEADNGAIHHLEYLVDNINSLPEIEAPISVHTNAH